jgi:hypothetical protein
MSVGRVIADPPPAMTLVKPAREPIPNRRSSLNNSSIGFTLEKLISQDILPF